MIFTTAEPKHDFLLIPSDSMNSAFPMLDTI